MINATPSTTAPLVTDLMDARGYRERMQTVHLLLLHPNRDAVLEILDEQLIDVLMRRSPIFVID